MLHISDSFPSQWVVVLEGVLVALGLVLGATSFRPLAAAGRAAGRALARMGRRPVLWIAAIACTSALLLGLQTSIVGAPQPRVVDEWCYLLAADTFAHNRMTNRPHPMAAHFEAPHVLQRPTYASKYPPAQGFTLAIGRVAAGHPAAGLWLSAALLVAAVGWMLLGLVPARWAVFGALLVSLRVGVGGYWNQTYWGGSIAAIGGALVLGALPRIWRQPKAIDAVVLALGVAILANSRPFEGLLVAIPAALILVIALLRGRLGRHVWPRVVLPVALLLALTGLGMTAYNRAVTGDPFVLPHEAHARANGIPHFSWEASEHSNPEYPTIPDSSGWHRLAVGFYFMLGLAGVLPFVLTRAALRGPWARYAAATLLIVAAAHFFTIPWFVHYSAPALAAYLLLAVQGQRLVRSASYGRGRGAPPHGAGRAWFGAACIIQVLVFLVQLPAYRADVTDQSRQRARLAWDFEGRPGKHLLLVDYPAGLGNDWTYNAADIDASKVVWANDLGDTANEELLAYYADRTVWRIDATFTATDPVPALVRAVDL